MTVKGLQANSKPSIFSIDDGNFSNGSSNSSSPSRDVNLNHLKIVHPAQRSPSHNQGFSPSSSPTREVPESPTQKSVVQLKEKKDDRYVIESSIEMVKNDEFVLKSPEKASPKPDVSSQKFPQDYVVHSSTFQSRDNDVKEESVNGRTAINIPGDLPSPKSKSPPAVVEKRNSLRSEQQQKKEPREHHRDHNGAKVSNHHINNNKVNSACLNNLILPLLSEVSWVADHSGRLPTNSEPMNGYTIHRYRFRGYLYHLYFPDF